MLHLHLQNTMYGTAHWAAPEVLRGEKATEASDIYSLGITMYEMFTRKIPSLGATPAYIRENVRSGIMRFVTKIEFESSMPDLMEISRVLVQYQMHDQVETRNKNTTTTNADGRTRRCCVRHRW